jgi:DNA-directed RNA polymerase subunit RPC12/RpoP
MSDIRFLCPACRVKLAIEASLADLVVPCPQCHQPIRACGAPLLDIHFRCPGCGTKLLIDSASAGAAIACPACSRGITVPTPYDQKPDSPARAEKTVAAVPLLSEAEVKFLAGETGKQARPRQGEAPRG